jgi:hypothetical protein
MADITAKLAEALRDGLAAVLDLMAVQPAHYGEKHPAMERLRAREAAMREALAQYEQAKPAEPVAWANMRPDGTPALLSISQHPEDRATWQNPVPLYAAPVAQAESMDMALCESTSVVLREGQLYRFRRVGDCERCAEMSKASFDAYGQPPKEST